MNEHWFEFLTNERLQSLRQEAQQHQLLSSLLKSRDPMLVQLARLWHDLSRAVWFWRNSKRGRG